MPKLSTEVISTESPLAYRGRVGRVTPHGGITSGLAATWKLREKSYIETSPSAFHPVSDPRHMYPPSPVSRRDDQIRQMLGNTMRWSGMQGAQLNHMRHYLMIRSEFSCCESLLRLVGFPDILLLRP